MGSKQRTYLSCIDEGLHAITEVPELRHNTVVRSLNLHSNSIQHIEGLGHLSNLASLNLSSNLISCIENLSGLVNLTSLNLANNCIAELRGLAGLSKLQQLNLSYNVISTIAGITDLQGKNGNLCKVNLQHNQLGTLQALAPLAGCLQLQQLQVGGNPCTLNPAAYAALRQVLPHVQHFDEPEGISIALGMQMVQAQLQAYDEQQQQELQQQRLLTEGSSRLAKKRATSMMAGRTSTAVLKQIKPHQQPHSPSSSSFKQAALPCGSSTSGSDSDASSGQAVLGCGHEQERSQQQSLSGLEPSPPLVQEAQQQPHGNPPSEAKSRYQKGCNSSSSATSRSEGKRAGHVAAGECHGSAEDCSVQTDEYVPEEAQKLQCEVQVLREQLGKLIGELSGSCA
jgi:hypothetical protein